jgi:hypothetical protein
MTKTSECEWIWWQKPLNVNEYDDKNLWMWVNMMTKSFECEWIWWQKPLNVSEYDNKNLWMWVNMMTKTSECEWIWRQKPLNVSEYDNKNLWMWVNMKTKTCSKYVGQFYIYKCKCSVVSISSDLTEWHLVDGLFKYKWID